MLDMVPTFAVILVVGSVSYVVGYWAGYRVVEKMDQQRAINLGTGRWRVNEKTGEPWFIYLTRGEILSEGSPREPVGEQGKESK